MKCTLCNREGELRTIKCQCEHCLWGNESLLTFHGGHCIAVKPNNRECIWFDFHLDELYKWTHDWEVV